MTTIENALVERVITLWGTKQKRSDEPMYKTNAKNEAKRLIATTFAIAKLKEQNVEQYRKFNIAIVHYTLLRFLGAPIIYSLTVYYFTFQFQW